MDLNELYDRRKKLVKKLYNVIAEKEEYGKALSQAENEYRKKLSKTMVKLNAGEIEDYGKVSWTSTYNIAKGIVADLMEKRDFNKYMYEVSEEKIWALRLEIKIIEADVNSFRNGNV